MRSSQRCQVWSALLSGLLLAACGETAPQAPVLDAAPGDAAPRRDGRQDAILLEQGQPEQGSSDTISPDAPTADAPIPDPDAVDYLIVAADSLAASAERYRLFRQSSGFVVSLILTGDLPLPASGPNTLDNKILSHVRSLFDLRDRTRPFYLLLLGDAPLPLPAGNYYDPQEWLNIPTDNIYADMDGDQIPDLAVGRIPAADDAALDLVRAKVESYESSYEVGMWNRRLNMFAGTAGFGGAEDEMITQAAVEILNHLSYNYDISFTYGSQSSEYVYVPEEFSDRVYQLINEGSLVTAYVGHGSNGSLDGICWGSDCFPILDETVLEPSLQAQHKRPILLLIACLTGAFPGGDSLAERFLRHAAGPVAVIASTEVSHPYGNAILAKELAEVLTSHLAPTAGELLRLAKERMINHQDSLRDMIEFFAMLLYDEAARTALRQSHLHLYALLGDPGTKIQLVRGAATLQLPAGAVAPGSTISASATISNLTGGNATFTLEASRREIWGKIQPVPPDGDPARDDVIRANYATANDRVVLKVDAPVTGAGASVDLPLPADLPAGTYYVKVYAEDGASDAFGHAPLEVKP